MPLRLEQIRPCDGACCKESPRWPNEDGSDCIYHDDKDERGCALMRDGAIMPIGQSLVQPDKTAMQCFKDTCVDWPQNMPGRGTGKCCWQWVED